MSQPKAAAAAASIRPISPKHYKSLEWGTTPLTPRWAGVFAQVFGTTPQRILYPDDAPHIESSVIASDSRDATEPADATGRADAIRELATRAGLGGGGSTEIVQAGDISGDRYKAEGWVFPSTFVREVFRAPPSRLIVIEGYGDSMMPTLLPGERMIIDTGHRRPTPDGLYAIRDELGDIVVKRLELNSPTTVKVISDNPKHGTREKPLDDLKIVGRVVGSLKVY